MDVDIRVGESPAEQGQQRSADGGATADILDGDPAFDGGGGYLNLATGEAWPQVAFDDGLTDGGDGEADSDLDDPTRWLAVPGPDLRAPRQDSWTDMRAFTDTCGNAALAAQLLDAIDGRGAFSRFRHVLGHHPGHIHRWQGFRQDRRSGRARSWLAHAGYDAIPPTA